MIVKLLQPHYFAGDRYEEVDTVLGGPMGRPLPERFLVTHDMEGLDDEARAAIAAAMRRWRQTDPIESLDIGGREKK
jgi:hypothetical protein